jgi:hypothetical protein
MNGLFEYLAGVHVPCHRNHPLFPSDPKLIHSMGGEIVQSGHTLPQSLGCAIFATTIGSSFRVPEGILAVANEPSIWSRKTLIAKLNIA